MVKLSPARPPLRAGTPLLPPPRPRHLRAHGRLLFSAPAAARGSSAPPLLRAGSPLLQPRRGRVSAPPRAGAASAPPRSRAPLLLRAGGRVPSPPCRAGGRAPAPPRRRAAAPPRSRAPLLLRAGLLPNAGLRPDAAPTSRRGSPPWRAGKAPASAPYVAAWRPKRSPTRTVPQTTTSDAFTFCCCRVAPASLSATLSVNFSSSFPVAVA